MSDWDNKITYNFNEKGDYRLGKTYRLSDIGEVVAKADCFGVDVMAISDGNLAARYKGELYCDIKTLKDALKTGAMDRLNGLEGQKAIDEFHKEMDIIEKGSLDAYAKRGVVFEAIPNIRFFTKDGTDLYPKTDEYIFANSPKARQSVETEIKNIINNIEKEQSDFYRELTAMSPEQGIEYLEDIARDGNYQHLGFDFKAMAKALQGDNLITYVFKSVPKEFFQELREAGFHPMSLTDTLPYSYADVQVVFPKERQRELDAMIDKYRFASRDEYEEVRMWEKSANSIGLETRTIFENTEKYLLEPKTKEGKDVFKDMKVWLKTLQYNGQYMENNGSGYEAVLDPDFNGDKDRAYAVVGNSLSDFEMLFRQSGLDGGDYQMDKFDRPLERSIVQNGTPNIDNSRSNFKGR